jgi:hypothetical protein
MCRYGLKMNPLKYAFGVSVGKFLGFIIHEHDILIDPKKVKAIKKVNSPTCKELQSFIGKVNYLRLIMLYPPILSDRIGKWAYSLIDYDLVYEPLKSTKDQIVVDFIIEHHRA